jgi:hypothetical protein
MASDSGEGRTVRKRAAVVIAGVILGALCSSARAQGTFTLTYWEANTPTHPLMAEAEQQLWLQPERPETVKALPEGVSGRALYSAAQVGGRAVPLVLYYSKSSKLLVDTDGDGDLAEEKPLEASQVKGGSSLDPGRLYSFGTFTVQPAAGQAAPVSCRARLQDYGSMQLLVLSPAGLVYGKAELGGASYRVALIDANLDGRYDSVFSLEHRGDCDRLAIDLNNDRTFDVRAGESQELIPLPRLLQVKDAYYTLQVAADGSTIRFDKTEPSFGTLDLGTPDATIGLVSDSGGYRFAGGEGKWRVPVGAYSVEDIVLSRTDQKGARWALKSSGGEFGNLARFDIREGETLSLKAGPPLVLKAEVQQEGRTVGIDFAVFGQAGERYSPAATRNDEEGPPPKLHILDESGNVLEKGSFEFG